MSGSDGAAAAPKPEMYDEVTAMVNAIAKALEIEPDIAAKAVEEGVARISLARGPEGERLIHVSYEGRTALVGVNAIERAGTIGESGPHSHD